MSHSCGQGTVVVNIETAHPHQDKMRILYEASSKDCVSTLDSLLAEEPELLCKISSQISFIDTPLHISASHGHLNFTKALLYHKPELALETNSSKSTPLHLASAEGHIDVVKELLKARALACLVRDQEGRIPLHYAVIRGRTEVARELAKVMSKESLNSLDNGYTVFHLCVKYNQLEILKDFVNLNIDGTNELLIRGDLDGKNTILHLAIMLKQVETVRCLVSIQSIRSEASSLKNDMGYTAADTVEQIPRDSRRLEIQTILKQECGINFENYGKVAAACLNFLRKLIGGDGDWVTQMRGNLSLVPTIVATITFQAAVSPPGGVVQQNILNSGDNKIVTSSTDYDTWLLEGPLGCLSFNGDNGNMICPGEAIYSHTVPNDFDRFMIFNTIAFVEALILAFLLLSGIPLKNRSMMWVLNLGMLSNLSFLLNAYFASFHLITPNNYGYYFDNHINVITLIFNGFCAVVAVFILVMWLVGLHKKRNTSG